MVVLIRPHHYSKIRQMSSHKIKANRYNFIPLAKSTQNLQMHANGIFQRYQHTLDSDEWVMVAWCRYGSALDEELPQILQAPSKEP